MEARKATREQAWSVGGWSDTVQQVSLSFGVALEANNADGQARTGHAVGYSYAHVVQPFEVVRLTMMHALGKRCVGGLGSGALCDQTGVADVGSTGVALVERRSRE